MAALAEVILKISVVDSTGTMLERDLLPVRWNPSGFSGQIQTLTFTHGAFTAITVPTGASAMLFEFDTTDISLVLKGVTGDSGVKLTPATNPVGCPMLVPLGASPSIGILNNGTADAVVQCTFI